MKYNLFLREQLKLYPFEISRNFINYEKWKRWTKYQPFFIKRYWKFLIKKDCRKLNRFLYRTRGVDKEQLYSIELLNTNTFYKICKRLKKKLGVDALEFFVKCVKQRRFQFTSISFLTLL